MKKIFLMIFLVVFSISIVACSQTSETTTIEITSIPEIVTAMSNPFNVGLFITETPETSMGINFKLSTDTEGYVEYHQSDLNDFIRIDAIKKITSVGSKTVYLYEAEMTGLTPGQTYEYFVSSSDGTEQSARYEFTISSGIDDSFTFMYLADPQGNAAVDYTAYAYSILNVLDYSQMTYDFVMSPGDTVNDHDVRSEWDWFFQYSSFFITRKPFVVTLGNHETGYLTDERINSLEFDGYFNLPNNGPTYGEFSEIEGDLRESDFDKGKTYSFDYGNAHIISINTEILCDGTTACSEYDHSNAEILKSWLRNDLDNSDKTWNIVLLHRGPYGLSYDTYNVRDVLAPIFDEFNVDLVLSGHEHQYSRAVYKNDVMIPFQEANNYERGILTLITDELYTNNFNNYSSTLGVTYFTGNTATVKFYGGDKNSGIEVQYKFIDESPVIPFITVTADSIQVVSYGVSKNAALDIVPTGVFILEEFTITK